MQLNRLAPLYKLSKSGKLQSWEIWTRGNEIHSKSGFVDGKKQEHMDIIKSGKMLGRKMKPHQVSRPTWKQKVNGKRKSIVVTTTTEMRLLTEMTWDFQLGRPQKRTVIKINTKR